MIIPQCLAQVVQVCESFRLLAKLSPYFADGLSMLYAIGALYDSQLSMLTGVMHSSNSAHDVQVAKSDDNVDHAVSSATK